MTAYSEIFYHLKPYIQDLIANMSSLNGSGAPSPHDLQSIHHTGTIGDSQATQFLKTDGSRNLTGNLAVSSLVTIDGVDIDIFQGTYNTHVSGDGHTDYVSKTIARTISAIHTFSPVSPTAPFILGANGQGQLVTGLRADQLNKSISAGAGLSGGGALTASQTLSVDQAYNFTFTGANTFTNTVSIQNTLTARDIVPASTDTYDLGTSLKLWRKGWLSELDAVLFAQNTITLLGGWFYVTKNEGAFPADVTSGVTTINFGQSMTVGDFVVMRAAGQVEYISVGSLVSGTTFNVTRNLDGSGANAWVAGTPYAVLGQNGNGRIELNAYDTPRISILKQGAAYNAQTEVLRLGDLNGSYGIVAERYGIGIGDYSGSNYLRYEPTGGFVLKGGAGGVTINGGGISLSTTSAYAATSALRFADASIGDLTDIWTYYDSGSDSVIFNIGNADTGHIRTNNSAGMEARGSSYAAASLIAKKDSDPTNPAYVSLVASGSSRSVSIGGTTVGIYGPMTINNSTLVTNLNSDTVDGADYETGTWTPSFTGFSANPSGGIYRYIRLGKTCIVFVEMPAGTSNGAGLTITAPFAAATVTNMFWRGVAGVITDNSAAQTVGGRVFIGSGGNSITCYKTVDSTVNWTTSGTKRSCFTLIYETA